MSQLDQNQIRGLDTALAAKVDKEEGKVLSDVNYSTAKDEKLTSLVTIKSIGMNLHLDPATGELIGTGGGGGSGVNLYDCLGQNVDGAINQKVVTDELMARENTIEAGTTSQYYRGDKTWQTLNKAAVGLGKVDNTSDQEKKEAFTGPIGSAGFPTGVMVAAAITTRATQSDMTQAQSDIADALTGVRDNKTEINTIKSEYVKVVASTTDIGENANLAANTLYAVYS